MFMVKQFMRLLVSSLILSFLVSCSKPEENFIKIPSEFSVSIVEQIQPSEIRHLYLEIASLTSTYCQEDTLVYNETLDSFSLNIEILDTYKANSCYERKYALSSLIPLPVFLDSLDILVSLGSASVIKCRVYILDKQYQIVILEGTGLNNTYQQTFKIPNNLIWGYAYPKSKEPTSESLMNSFKKEVEFDCLTHRLDPGFYSYFTITDNNSILFKADPGIAGNYIKLYYFHSKTNAELDLFFSDLADKYFNLVGYKINIGSGKEYHAY